MINRLESNGMRFSYFFYPELENFIDKDKMGNVKNELLLMNPNAFENFDAKRHVGENDSHLCSLIREDSIDDFIVYVNQRNYSLSSAIIPSIFETNSFLNKNKRISLIEYAAFFGSIQIFRYLLLNGVKLSPSIWLYVVHSNNAELIHLLESIDLNLSEKKYLNFLIESIKCHHNDFAEYIENNLLLPNESESQQREEIISNSIKYYNYSYFKNELIYKYGFFYLCFYKYNKLVNDLLKKKENEIESKTMNIHDIFILNFNKTALENASENNEIELIYY